MRLPSPASTIDGLRSPAPPLPLGGEPPPPPPPPAGEEASLPTEKKPAEHSARGAPPLVDERPLPEAAREDVREGVREGGDAAREDVREDVREGGWPRDDVDARP
eukprot:4024163-Prymnesium_polylepis.1